MYSNASGTTTLTTTTRACVNGPSRRASKDSCAGCEHTSTRLSTTTLQPSIIAWHGGWFRGRSGSLTETACFHTIWPAFKSQDKYPSCFSLRTCRVHDFNLKHVQSLTFGMCCPVHGYHVPNERLRQQHVEQDTCHRQPGRYLVPRAVVEVFRSGRCRPDQKDHKPLQIVSQQAPQEFPSRVKLNGVPN